MLGSTTSHAVAVAKDTDQAADVRWRRCPRRPAAADSNSSAWLWVAAVSVIFTSVASANCPSPRVLLGELSPRLASACWESTEAVELVSFLATSTKLLTLPANHTFSDNTTKTEVKADAWWGGFPGFVFPEGVPTMSFAAPIGGRFDILQYFEAKPNSSRWFFMAFAFCSGTMVLLVAAVYMRRWRSNGMKTVNNGIVWKPPGSNPKKRGSSVQQRFAECSKAYNQARHAGEIAPPRDVDASLYGLYKQATTGDMNIQRPSTWMRRARARWQAWSALRGISPTVAMDRYVRLVEDVWGDHGWEQPSLQDQQFLATAQPTQSRLSSRFEEATKRIAKLTDFHEYVLSASEQRNLYGLFQQATYGNLKGKRPSEAQYKEQDNWDAWASVKGYSCLSAMEAYVGVADEVCERAARENAVHA